MDVGNSHCVEVKLVEEVVLVVSFNKAKPLATHPAE